MSNNKVPRRIFLQLHDEENIELFDDARTWALEKIFDCDEEYVHIDNYRELLITLNFLVSCVLDSKHQDPLWNWCWNGLSDEAQEMVKRARQKALTVHKRVLDDEYTSTY